jgi:hypothetical protein
MARVTFLLLIVVFGTSLSGCVSTYMVKRSDIENTKRLRQEGMKSVVVPAKDSDSKDTFLEVDSITKVFETSAQDGWVKVEATDLRPGLRIMGWSTIGAALLFTIVLSVDAGLEPDEDFRKKDKAVAGGLSAASLTLAAIVATPMFLTAYIWRGPEEATSNPSPWAMTNPEDRPLGVMATIPW